MSMRECEFCYVGGTKAQSRVDVNPHYSYIIRNMTSPVDLHNIPYIDIEEKFICPKCGQINVKTYSFTPNQEDLKYFVDKLISRGNQ